MRLAPALAATVTLLLVGCNDKTPAPTPTPVAPVSAAATAASPPEGAAAFRFTQADSKIGFVGSNSLLKQEGSFGTFDGTVHVPGTDLEKGVVSVSIDMPSVTTATPQLTKHLQSADFFEVEAHPKATFASTRIQKAGDGYTVTGNLTLRGVTKTVSFPAKITLAGDTVTADADFKLNRKDFGVSYPGMKDNLIRDEVDLKIAIKAKKG